MSSSRVSLLQLPEDPMKHILEYLDFQSILILRKVCHDLRNFIDVTKPASHLTEIKIDVNSDIIRFSIKSRTPNEICIYYEKCNEGCLVKKFHQNAEIERTILDNEDFVTVFCQDFDIILRHQKTALEFLEINFYTSNYKVKKSVLESVKKSLKSMKHLLQVKSLFMAVDDHNEILSILPYMDPKLLKKMHISERSGRFNVVLNLDEIGQLEQWKQAEELAIRGFQLPDLAQNLKHSSTIDLYYRGTSIEELILLKETFLLSSTLNTVEISTNSHCSAVIEPRLIEQFGEPLVDNSQDRNWFFRIPDTNQFLRITHFFCYINLNRIEQSDLPQSAYILN